MRGIEESQRQREREKEKGRKRKREERLQRESRNENCYAGGHNLKAATRTHL